MNRGSTVDFGVNLQAAPAASYGYVTVPLSALAPITIGVASSRPEVGTVKPAALTIPAGQGYGTITFTPLAARARHRL